MTDLFGNPLQELIDGPMVGRPKRKDPTPSGHCARPGTGPEGETCGTCAHLVRREYAKTYLKCGLNEARWTGGRKSDVRAKDAACSKWDKG